MIYKKIFLLKQNDINYLCTMCHKSALRGSKTKFMDCFS